MSALNPLFQNLNHPVPDVLNQLSEVQQQEVFGWVEQLITDQNEGVDELYNAISSIVKFIPNFMVIPLMVEQIHPRIAAGVCVKMGVEKATSYANDLPIEYLSNVMHYLSNQMAADILASMKRYSAEKLLHYEQEHYNNQLQTLLPYLTESLREVLTKAGKKSMF